MYQTYPNKRLIVVVLNLVKFSDIMPRIAVPFLGGFLGALGVALVGYSFGVLGISRLFGAASPTITQHTITQQGLQNISWGGAMWGLIPAIFLIVRRGNIYLISLVTTIVAVTYGQFVLAHSPLLLSTRLIYGYSVNLTYTIILSLTIKAAGLHKKLDVHP